MIEESIFAIVNPVAGQESGETVSELIEQYFADCNIYLTTGDEDMDEVVQTAVNQHNPSFFIVVGGDGTVSEVASALVPYDKPLAIIPKGTSNALARDLNLPLDVEEACQAYADGMTEQKIDLMKVGDRYHTLQVGVGIDAQMIHDVEREHKDRFGILAYVAGAAKALATHEQRTLSLTVDGESMEKKINELMILNAASIGVGDATWGKHIELDDGRLDLCLIQTDTQKDLFAIFTNILNGKLEPSEEVNYLKAKNKITIEAEEPSPVQIDGEPWGETPITIECIPQALTLLVPTN